jgi:F-type H+-transporting ATPase subunit epsilon
LAKFSLRILNPKHVVFQGEAESVFLPGDAGEFELLAYHVPIVSLLKEGEIVVDWKTRIPIKRGMVRFMGEECVVLIEPQSQPAGGGKATAHPAKQGS